jgi:photosynthetic reaction center H subunit
MMRGAILHLDVAQLVLYAFFVFFAGLIWYLRQEDRREGYPLESEADGVVRSRGFLFIPAPKTFRLADGSVIKAPTLQPDARPLNAAKVEPWPGAPFEPTGDPLLSGVGPGAFAVRPDFPAKTHDGHTLIAPMRVATNYTVAPEGGNPLGFVVIGVDRKAAGAVKDIWVDRAETTLRYYEVALENSRSALIPVRFADVNFRARSIKVNALRASQFAQVPALADPDCVTMQEEDKIAAFYGAGTLYATPARAEPLL